jgi:hypothetical protein
MTTTTIEKVKKGEFFMLRAGEPKMTNVYTAEGYCRMNRKYTGGKYSDISACVYRKKGTIVYIDFEF